MQHLVLATEHQTCFSSCYIFPHRVSGKYCFAAHTIRLYLAIVRSHQLDLGYSELMTFHGLHCVIAGIREIRSDGGAEAKDSLPRTIDLLLKNLTYFPYQ